MMQHNTCVLVGTEQRTARLHGCYRYSISQHSARKPTEAWRRPPGELWDCVEKEGSGWSDKWHHIGDLWNLLQQNPEPTYCDIILL